MQYEAKIEVPKEKLALMDKYCDARPGEYPEVVRRHGGYLFNVREQKSPASIGGEMNARL